MADTLDYRTATPDDLPALHALIEGAYRGEAARAGWTHEADLLEGPRTSLADLASLIELPDSAILLFHDESGLFACAHVSRKSADAGYVGMLTVDPQRQAGGLGKRILAAAETDARDRLGAKTLALTVVHERTELIAYYERRGFVLTGERLPFPIVTEPPLFLLAMEKPLGGTVA